MSVGFKHFAGWFRRWPLSIQGTGQGNGHRQGHINALLAFLLLAVMSAAVKGLDGKTPLIMILFSRFLFGFLCQLPLLLRPNHWPKLLASKQYNGHIVHALFGLSAVGLNFFALPQLPLGDASALSLLTPLLMLLLAPTIMDEVVTPRQWLMVGTGFLGVLLIARPTGSLASWPVFLMIIAAIFAALSQLMVRRLTTTDSNATIFTYYHLSALLLLAWFMPASWHNPDWQEWILLLVVGLAGGLAQMLLTQAYRLLPATQASPYEYTSFVWSVLFGLLIWHEQPHRLMLLGGAIIIASSWWCNRHALKNWRHRPDEADDAQLNLL
jgi:drug/metabolite transporter (DMT)-like permease